MEAIVIEKTIAYGKNRFEVNKDGKWQVFLFGTSMARHTPHYFWDSIDERNVPDEVLKAGAFNE